MAFRRSGVRPSLAPPRFLTNLGDPAEDIRKQAGRCPALFAKRPWRPRLHPRLPRGWDGRRLLRREQGRHRRRLPQERSGAGDLRFPTHRRSGRQDLLHGLRSRRHLEEAHAGPVRHVCADPERRRSIGRPQFSDEILTKY